MYVTKIFPISGIWKFSWHHILWMTIWGAVTVSLYEFTHWKFLAIPWLPVSLVGTAVAFYLGFKNNSSYDRIWEARKIWGAIVNGSRSWSTAIKNFVTTEFALDNFESSEVHAIHKRIIYRHIAWIYTIRHQLLMGRKWEHLQDKISQKLNEKRVRRFDENFKFPDFDELMDQFLDKEEIERLARISNNATQLLDHQSMELKNLKLKGLVDDFRHMELQALITDFYTQQGKLERIKNFPFPRQYGATSFYFVAIFMVLLPFGMLSEFEALGEGLIWLTVPFTTIVGWVFIMMELVGDYSENPFERLGNDIPMFSICRGIEIDLREMLGETDVPPKVEDINGVLM